MKKIFFILTVFISTLFLSCKSAPSETFVNTGIDTQGKIFTVCVFSKITNVTVKEFESDKPQQNILPDDIQYNPKTTELKINIPEGFSENKENTAKSHRKCNHFVAGVTSINKSSGRLKMRGKEVDSRARPRLTIIVVSSTVYKPPAYCGKIP